ncbi:MAG: ATP-binding protein [Acidimicrobiales bacterium]|nr:ATP-binding protein [Acidimicrobiales bacterium]
MRAARAFVTEQVDGPDRLREELALVVSELAANAVLHTSAPFTVSVTRSDDAVRIEVEDGSAVLPRVADHGDRAPTGRGLRIVDQLARARGARPTGTGKVVWAEVARAGDGISSSTRSTRRTGG